MTSNISASDTLIFDEAGELVAEVLGLTCKRLVGAGSHQTDTLVRRLLRVPLGAGPTRCRPSRPHLRLHQCRPDRRRVGCRRRTGGTVGGGGHPAAGSFASTTRGDFDELLADVPLDRRTLIVFAAGLTAMPLWLERTCRLPLLFRRSCNSLRRCTGGRGAAFVRGHQRRGGCARRPAAGFGPGDSARHGTRHQQRMPQCSADGDRSECSDPAGRSRRACITSCCTAAAIGTNRKSPFAATNASCGNWFPSIGNLPSRRRFPKKRDSAATTEPM